MSSTDYEKASNGLDSPQVVEDPIDPTIEPKSETTGQKGVDVAYAAFQESQNIDITEEQFYRVRRKIDLHLMPLLMITGFLQYFDKQAITYAVNYNLRADLHLVGKQYSWANSIFYFGYLVWQFPSLLLMQRFPVGAYFSSQVFLWGVFSFGVAGTTNFAGLATLRFLIGAAESVQLATFALITGMYYKRDEQPFRLLGWYSMNGVAIIAGGLFSYGVGHFGGSVALWKYPFLISGALSVTWAVVLWFTLPSNPATAWFLSPEERVIAVARVQQNQTGVESKVFKSEQAIEALLDPKVWLTALSTGSGNILGGVAAFAAIIIRGFGFTPLQTTLIQCPSGLIDLISLVIFTTLATYIPNSRFAFATVATIIATAGAVILYVVEPTNRWLGITGFWLATGFIPTGFILGLGAISANIGGHTKKITAQALYFICYSVGNIVGPQLYTTAPYRQGLRANIVALSLVVVLGLLQIFYLSWENKKRRAYLEAHRHELNEVDFQFRDLTDKQNPFCFNAM
ncbi:allantoate permease [Leptodontidium sp. 2 PMI_412]|nr:allantoate permease [Leptodontidium sp. 2 PMI_412]